jgi:hypothetical protein
MSNPSFTVYVDNVGTPHTFIKLDSGNGRVDHFGFAPASAGSPHGVGNVGEGLANHAKGDPQNKAAGYIDDVGWSKTITVTSAQHDAMVNAVAVWRGANHTYNGLAKLGGENCATFVQFVAKAGNITEIVTSRASLPINLIPADERRALFTTDADGRRSLSEAMTNPLNTPGTPAYEFKQSNPELFRSEPNARPTPDSTNSRLHQNKDGSFTEDVEQSGGDSVKNEYTSQGVLTSSTEIDGARNDADYASRTMGYDSEGRQDWRSTKYDDGTSGLKDFDQDNQRGERSTEVLTDAQGLEDWKQVIYDDGSVHWNDFDQKNEFGHRSWENLVDAQGREDWQRVTHDDSSVHWKDLDQRNEFGHRSWENLADAQGREDWQRVTHDDSSVHWKDFDQKSEFGHRIWENLVDAQGREDWQRVTHDDGAVHWKDFDQRTEVGHRIWENLVDAQGREDWQRVTHDDGSVHGKDFDQKNEHGYRIWENLVDAKGREDWQRVTHDDGSVHGKDFDQKNELGYRVWEHLVDVQGREDWQLLTQDDGRSDRFDFDQDSSKPWSKVEQHFDAQGREDNAYVYNDDGSRLEINYDQDGTQSWSQQTATFNAFGVQVARSMTFDNGIVSNEQGSGSHFSYSSGGMTHVYDPYVHHGGGRDMPLNSACVGTSDGWSCEPRYGESYGH